MRSNWEIINSVKKNNSKYVKMKNCITKICIENVKGLSKWEFCDELLPNRPHIFVAPNGYGKSSFAIAFKSLNENRIALDEKHFHRRNSLNKPKIEITYSHGSCAEVYRATDNENSISPTFDIHVINSPLDAKAVRQNHGRYTTAIASMEIEPIVLVKTIPAYKKFNYKISEMWLLADVKCHSYWKNIKNIVYDYKSMIFFETNADWLKLESRRTEKQIDSLLHEVADSTVQLAEFSQESIEEIKKNKELYGSLVAIQKIIQRDSILESFFVLLQIMNLRKKDKKYYRDVIKWYSYCIEKESYTQLIRDLNSSWNNIVPKEHNKKLIVEFPDAEYISNGQRDILSFVIRLYSTTRSLKKDKTILIIDEIFDYFDEANLVAFQYYIAKFIQDSKRQGKEIYPILMTHLDPLLFSHFRLNKICVHHLDDRSFSDLLHLKKLIILRSDASIKSFVDHYLFHYCPEQCNKIKEFNDLQLKKTLADTATFHPLMREEVRKYLNGQEADPFAICIALRIKLEQWAYDYLSSESLKAEFISTHETQKKLEFAADNGVRIPELFYLLGIIYNSSLHATTENIDILGKRLLRNLTNATIKHMIGIIFKI